MNFDQVSDFTLGPHAIIPKEALDMAALLLLDKTGVAAGGVQMDAGKMARQLAVEPELFDDTRRSLASGKREDNPKGRRTICDSIMTPTPNEMTFSINRHLLAGGLVACDDEVRQAMRFAFEAFKIVVEPGAAVGIAAVLSGKLTSPAGP